MIYLLLFLSFSFFSSFDARAAASAENPGGGGAAAAPDKENPLDPQLMTLNMADSLITEGKILEAERLLRETVLALSSPDSPVHPKVWARYILLLHSEIFDSSKHFEESLKQEIWDFFKAFSLKELEVYLEQPDGQTLFALVSSLSLNGTAQGALASDEDSEDTSEENPFLGRSLPKQPERLRGQELPFLTIARGEATAVLAYLLYKVGNNGDANQVVEQLFKLNPNLYLAHWLNGVLKQYLFANFEETVSSYRRAGELCPEFSYSFYSLACLIQETLFTKAQIEAANDEQKEEMKTHNRSASEVFIALSDRCLEVDPRHFFAKINKLHHLWKQGSHLDYVSEAAEMLQIFPIQENIVLFYVYFSKAALRNLSQEKGTPALSTEEGKVIWQEAIRVLAKASKAKQTASLNWELGSLFLLNPNAQQISKGFLFLFGSLDLSKDKIQIAKRAEQIVLKLNFLFPEGVEANKAYRDWVLGEIAKRLQQP